MKRQKIKPPWSLIQTLRTAYLYVFNRYYIVNTE